MKKILCIENNQDTAESVKTILNLAGFETEIAGSGKEGVRKVEENFDLILLDIMMPDMSGWDVFTKLKGKTKAKFIFLSAIPISSERIEELRNAGVSDYITKPFIKSDLICRINKILEK